MSESSFAPGSVLADEIEALERRITQRHPCTMLASCFLDPSRELLWGSICDISLAGIGVVMDRCLQPETRMLIQLRSASEASLIALAARVTHCSGLSPGRWTVGCRFIGDLSNNDLRALLSQ